MSSDTLASALAPRLWQRLTLENCHRPCVSGILTGPSSRCTTGWGSQSVSLIFSQLSRPADAVSRAQQTTWKSRLTSTFRFTHGASTKIRKNKWNIALENSCVLRLFWALHLQWYWYELTRSLRSFAWSCQGTCCRWNTHKQWLSHTGLLDPHSLLVVHHQALCLVGQTLPVSQHILSNQRRETGDRGTLANSSCSCVISSQQAERKKASTSAWQHQFLKDHRRQLLHQLLHQLPSQFKRNKPVEGQHLSCRSLCHGAPATNSTQKTCAKPPPGAPWQRLLHGAPVAQHQWVVNWSQNSPARSTRLEFPLWVHLGSHMSSTISAMNGSCQHWVVRQ